MKIEMRKMEDVKPYPGNPRRNESAVEAVAASIKEFGFRQPVVVDEAGQIIVGHTRYLAALKLKLESVPVHVAEGLTPEQAKAYRLEDNKSGEHAEWDFGKLKVEFDMLRDSEFDVGRLSFTPEDLGWIETPTFEPVDEDEQPRLDQKSPIECPECGHEFTT